MYRRTEGHHSLSKYKAHDRTKYDLCPHFKGSVQVRGPMKCLVTSLSLYRELLPPRPSPNLEDHPLSAVRD